MCGISINAKVGPTTLFSVAKNQLNLTGRTPSFFDLKLFLTGFALSLFFSNSIFSDTLSAAQPAFKEEASSNGTSINSTQKTNFEKAKFLDLQYRNIQANKTKINEIVDIEVENSASPLFYKLDRLVESIEIGGSLEVERPIENLENDAYFSVGLVYEGSYKPGFLARMILPDWLLSVLKINPSKGIGEIYFFEASPKGFKRDEKKSMSGIEFISKTHSELKNISENKKAFHLKIKPEKKNLLGLWVRSEGDDSKAKFNATIDLWSVK